MKIEQLAINAVSTRHADFIECLDAYAAAGFKHIEFPLWEVKKFIADGHTVADARKELDARGVDCIGGWEMPVLSFGSAKDTKANRDLLLANAQLLCELGGTGMVCGTDGPGEGQTCEDVLAVLVDGFGAAADLIAPTGVTILLEFNWSPIVKSFRTAADIVRRAGRDNLGVVFDPCHYHCTPSKFEQLTPENVATIRHIHVDNMADKPGELSCDGDRVLPGAGGCLDLKAIFARIEEFGYDGYFSIEMFSEELWAMPAAQAARKMYDSLLTLMN